MRLVVVLFGLVYPGLWWGSSEGLKLLRYIFSNAVTRLRNLIEIGLDLAATLIFRIKFKVWNRKLSKTTSNSPIYNRI